MLPPTILETRRNQKFSSFCMSSSSEPGVTPKRQICSKATNMLQSNQHAPKQPTCSKTTNKALRQTLVVISELKEIRVDVETFALCPRITRSTTFAPSFSSGSSGPLKEDDPRHQ